MKIIINQNELLETLQKVSGCVSGKQNFPILNTTLLETNSELISFTTTDLNTTIISYVKAKIEEKGKIAIPFKRFISIIRELPKEEIILTTVKNNLLICCGNIEYRINCMESEEFPQVEKDFKKTLIRVSSETLQEMIKMTSFCVGMEETSYVLNGILFEFFKDELKLVSTDGKRLSCICKKLPPQQAELSSKIEFIFPIKSVYEVQRLIKEKQDDIFVFIEENVVGFDLKDTIFISKPIEGEFPNYSQYIPSPTEVKLKINRQKFLSALKRAQVLSTPDYQGVKLEFKKKELIVLKSTPQLGEVKESIEAEYSGNNLEIGFNPTYLIDVLKNLEEEEVVFEIYGPDKPAVIRKDDYVYLVLPMRL